jgi:hypothetical protein
VRSLKKTDVLYRRFDPGIYSFVWSVGIFHSRKMKPPGVPWWVADGPGTCVGAFAVALVSLVHVDSSVVLA